VRVGGQWPAEARNCQGVVPGGLLGDQLCCAELVSMSIGRGLSAVGFRSRRDRLVWDYGGE